MTKLSANNIDFDKSQGLVPVIVQDNRSKEILMLAYVNRLALDETIKTGYGHYWSRSRNKLWKKGEESGNIQKVLEIKVDCDEDTLIYLVEQTGNACHKNTKACFQRDLISKDQE